MQAQALSAAIHSQVSDYCSGTELDDDLTVSSCADLPLPRTTRNFPEEALMPNTSVHVSNHPLVAHKLGKLRHRDTDPKRFRELIREIAALLSYEATQDLALSATTVPTPLAERRAPRCSRRSDWYPSCAPDWDGRRRLGSDADRRSLAHRPVPG